MMRHTLHFPLLIKVLAWLVLHLLILGLAFFGFVRWQLGLGLDSLLSGSAGDRLTAFADSVAPRMVGKRPEQWNEAILPLAREKQVTAGVFGPPEVSPFPRPIPANVVSRAKEALPPPPGENGRPPPDFLNGPPPRPREEESMGSFQSRPVFLMRGDDGGYWAGVALQRPPLRGAPNHPILLLLHAERLDGSGMFFNFKPWLWGGVAVLGLSLAFWTPFVWSITRYLRHLTTAANRIAAGRFQVSLPARGNDELGQLGRSVEGMAARLDHLIAGQKRFLGDAAHELCAPLARIRTALGILETRLADSDSTLLASIEADTTDLASLVDEILAFSRTGNRQPVLCVVALEPLIREVIAREAATLEIVVRVSKDVSVVVDRTLLARALSNLFRNAATHAGPNARVKVEVDPSADGVAISVTDDGPGIPESELRKIFEPFHRLDLARSRETGGSGLGLAIVRSAVEACHGEVHASLPASGGLCVTLRLPRELAAS